MSNNALPPWDSTVAFFGCWGLAVGEADQMVSWSVALPPGELNQLSALCINCCRLQLSHTTHLLNYVWSSCKLLAVCLNVTSHK